MAKRFMTGLEAGDLGVFSATSNFAATVSINNVNPRTGTYCLLSVANGGATNNRYAYTNAPILPLTLEIYIRAFLRITSYPSVANREQAFIVVLDDIGTVHLSLGLTNLGTIQLTRGGPDLGTLLASWALLNVGQYYQIELRCTIADAGGIAQVRVDGVERINFVGDTRNGGNANIGNIWFGMYREIAGVAIETNSWRLDDIAVNDTAGAVNNSWPGNSAIYGLLPTGAGNYSNLTRGGVDSGANWSQVDETPPDDDTEYVYDVVADVEDTYAMANLPVSGDVAALQWLCRAKQDVAGPDAIARLLRMGGVDYQGGDLPLTVAYAYYQEIMETNPATGFPWAISEIDAMEAGVKTR